MAISIWRHLFGVVVVAFSSGCLALTPDECFGGSDHASYINWVSERGSSYSAAICYNSLSSDVSQGVALHWKVDDDNVYIAVAARATGWVGFGLAETGGMKGADMVLFEIANPGQLRDAHVLDELLPVTDDCQDWVFVNSRSEGGFIIFEGYRKVRTVDAQDRDISDDVDPSITAQRIIAAWGDSPTASYHGLNRAKGSLRWYGGGDELELVKRRMETTADGYFDLLAPNYTLEAIETNYVSFCYSWDPDFVMQGVPSNQSISVVAALVISSEESRPFVHHAVAHGSSQASNNSECLPKSAYTFPIYSWAPGVLPFVLPDNVGLTIGPGSGLQSFLIEFHYNNPELIENITDNGGLRVYYSLTPRKDELGILLMGDILGALFGSPISSGLSRYDFACSSACSSFALSHPVTVIQEGFHMHKEGHAAASYQIRNGEVIREAHVDFFDFDQTGAPLIRQEPFTINPGDSFTSSFYFKSKNGTTFGKSSFQEMSFQFLLYYPAVELLDTFPWTCTYDLPVSVCNSTIDKRVLAPNDPIERVFGQAPIQCSDKASVNETTSSSLPIATSWFVTFGFWLLVTTTEYSDCF